MTTIAVWVFDHGPGPKYQKHIVVTENDPSIAVLITEENICVKTWDLFLDAINLALDQSTYDFNIIILHSVRKRRDVTVEFVGTKNSIGLVHASNGGRALLKDFQTKDCKEKGVVAITSIEATEVIDGIAGEGESSVKKCLTELMRAFSEKKTENLKNLFVEYFYKYFPDLESEAEKEKHQRIESLINEYFNLSLVAVSPATQIKQRDLRAQLSALCVTVVSDDRE